MSIEFFTDHRWIADVLSDIDKYAAKNNLKRLQAMIAETRIIAQEEIIARDSQSNFDAVMAVLYPKS